MNSLAAQAFVFFVAGFETSSTTMTFCLYELSLHQDIQDRLREEIDVVLQKHDGKLTYEGIQEMEYLDKVVSGNAQILKNILNSLNSFFNTAMSLEHLSLLHINFHSKLKITINHKLQVFSARELFSTWSILCFFNFNVAYRIHSRLLYLHAGVILCYIEAYVTILTFSFIG
jgi:hypothetical protein